METQIDAKLLTPTRGGIQDRAGIFSEQVKENGHHGVEKA